MADTALAPHSRRVIDRNVIEELTVLHKKSGLATTPEEAASAREGLWNTLFAIECLPLTAEHMMLRARALAVLYDGTFEEFEDHSPAGVLVKQILQTLIA